MREIMGKTKSYLAGGNIGIRTMWCECCWRKKWTRDMRPELSLHTCYGYCNTIPGLFVWGQTQGFAGTGVCVPSQRTRLGNSTVLKKHFKRRAKYPPFLPTQNIHLFILIFQMNTFLCQVHYTITQTQLLSQNPEQTVLRLEEVMGRKYV